MATASVSLRTPLAQNPRILESTDSFESTDSQSLRTQRVFGLFGVSGHVVPMGTGPLSLRL